MSSFAARDYGPLNCPVIILNVRTAPALVKHLANISHKTLEYLGERGCHRQQQQEIRILDFKYHWVSKLLLGGKFCESSWKHMKARWESK